MRSFLRVFLFVILALILAPTLHAQGGPDGFGYEYDVSSALFDWIDISATGTDLGLDSQDSTGQVPIGFDFDFYGYTYSQLNVGANGLVYFTTDTVVGGDNVCIPGPHSYGSGDYPMIAAFWDDLSLTSASAVYYQVIGTQPERQAYVMWDQVSRTGTSGQVSFEVVLRESDASVLIMHQDTNVGDPAFDNGQSATIGIQDWGQDQSYGLEYSCNSPAIVDGRGILFSTNLPPQFIFGSDFETGDFEGWSNVVGG